MTYSEKDIVKCVQLFVDEVEKMKDKNFNLDAALLMGKEILHERNIPIVVEPELLLDMNSVLLH